MSVNVANAMGGEHATSRRGSVDTYEVAFISQKMAAGLPPSQIAKQLGRPLADITPYFPRPVPVAPVVAPAPRVVLKTPKAPAGPPPVRPTRDYIARMVADAYGVDLADLLGPKRYKVLSAPRQEAMWRMMQEKRWFLHEVASYFGRTDHTTIVHACRRHEWRMENAPHELAPASQEAENRRAVKSAARAAKKAAYDAARRAARRASRLAARQAKAKGKAVVRPFRTDAAALPDVDLWKRLGAGE